MPSKILFLVPYPLKQAPSQRFRFEQYLKLLNNEGYTIELQSFLTSQNWQLFFKKGHQLGKAAALGKGFLKRLLILGKVRSFDFIFIHREISPLGPPVFEWIIAKVLRKKIIYDFDDAIWLTDRSHENPLLRFLKWRSKVKWICRWAYKVSAGNEYLCAYASRYNHNVIYNPTTVDTEKEHNPRHSRGLSELITIGWTGTHSTVKYLRPVANVLERLFQLYHPRLRITIIADREPDFIPNYNFIRWTRSTEIEDLLQIDIGIMPLPDDEWSKGKCGFKALQYLALEIPAIVSPVGVNTRIVSHGENGFLCATDDEWFEALKKLIEDPKLRVKMGAVGRLKVISDYSVISNRLNFLSLFAKS
jgi:glycosyltransferase involved in cell wall biosynthesis